MEECGGTNAVALTLEVGAAGELDIFALLDVGKMPVDQTGVGQRPQVLGGLQLRGIGGLELEWARDSKNKGEQHAWLKRRFQAKNVRSVAAY